MKITIVYNKENNRLIPFQYGDSGEIILLSTDPDLNLDNCIVSMVDLEYVDFDNGLFIQPSGALPNTILYEQE